MNNIYSEQYNEYLTWFDEVETIGGTEKAYKLKPNVPQEQIEILQKKKKIFKEVWPLLKSYSAYAVGGGRTQLISDAEKRATVLIQQLIDMDKGG
jgi:hypothetical protein